MNSKSAMTEPEELAETVAELRRAALEALRKARQVLERDRTLAEDYEKTRARLAEVEQQLQQCIESTKRHEDEIYARENAK